MLYFGVEYLSRMRAFILIEGGTFGTHVAVVPEAHMIPVFFVKYKYATAAHKIIKNPIVTVSPDDIFILIKYF